ncbi:NUDIX hydrolase [Siphonobacter aquaeclarae]|jgi:8-oxo-dGTP diphosphatase|uniref:ADP-ribose pyrophosphatase YjhB, NUDIX family n=1 Tax=Siphonobacter aquaeclarae TaxID=563176 RepID=A0A1G9R775_9BACT|nr:NUDIX domain-containing protein [Siphonobacter aquaeclarae]MBO9640685.1 NUDIX hydrolase [Siphonobacter aquaeclarae]SDM19149.1 ADP-ribose pyrophosphatase YjhB, NUDIX family [Siphonobacter aquaeclarae]
MIEQYQAQKPYLVALDSIIFGFDGEQLNVLLVKRGIEEDTWSLMGGWLRPDEGLAGAAERILFELTGLTNVYLEQLHTFGEPDRDPVTRTVSVAYFALVNVADFDSKISETYQARWFSLYDLPPLLFDHGEMVDLAIRQLRYKAAQHPIGFELLPEKFTIPQLKKLYDAIYDTDFDKRNFSRKILSTNLLIKLEEKQKGVSRRGAYFYQVDLPKYQQLTKSFLNFVPHSETIFW